MKFWRHGLGMILLMIIIPYGAAGEVWDLQHCLEIGLQQNPRLMASLQALEAAKARVVQVRSDYYPEVFIEGDYSRYKGSLSGTSNPNSVSAADLNAYTMYMGLNQNIYDFGRREYRVKASTEDLKTYRWDLKDTRLGVIDEIRSGYYGVLLAGRGEKVREQELERTQLFLRQARGFYQVGLKPRIDVTQAELEVTKAQRALLQAQNALQLSRVALNKALGLDQAPPYELRDDLEAERIQWQLEDLKKEALDGQPTLNRFRSLVQFWEAQVKGAERDFWPRLAGTARFGRNSTEIPLVDYTESWNVGLQLTVPIFSGFESRAKLDEYRAALSQAKANSRNQELQILNDVQNQYLNLVLAGKQIEVAGQAVGTARENLDLAQGRYQAGVGTMLEVNDARVSWVQAENDYTQSLYDYRIARFKLERTLGRDLYTDDRGQRTEDG
jgi:outer membrane protein TolC